MTTTRDTFSQDSPNSNDSITLNQPVVKNFRPVQGLAGIYRCADTDGLATLCPCTVSDDENEAHFVDKRSDAERIILEDAGLIIDLRTPSERNSFLAERWMSRAPGGPFQIFNAYDIPSIHRYYTESSSEEKRHLCRKRVVLRLDVLQTLRFFEYVEKHWFSASDKFRSVIYHVFDSHALHNLRIDRLNERGLVGLNEIILETGKSELCLALKAMTIYVESLPVSSLRTFPIIIHCVQGKDRTGILVMLCQSIMGLSDCDIIDCYHKSEYYIRSDSALGNKIRSKERGRINKGIFMASPRHVMETTIHGLRRRYGSIDPEYLENIGFHQGWRTRFRKVMTVDCPSRL